MASSSSLLSEDQFLCPICLGVFNQPVSTPCGHNYCMSCLTSYWDTSSVCLCPVCKETFSQRPDLRVNTFISGLAEQFMTLQLCQDQTHSRVQCDICTETQRDAVKSCVDCLTSYCEAHLEPHHRVSGLKRHTLLDPLSSLKDRVCTEHNRLLAFFCPNEGVLLCKDCARTQHSNHETVQLQQAYRDLRAELGGTEVRVHTQIQERLQKVSSIKESVKHRQDETKYLFQSVKDLSVLVKKMEDKQQEADSEAVALIKQIEQEVKGLRDTEDKLKDLKQTKDQHIFLQNYPHKCLRSETTDFSLNSEVELQLIRRSLSSCLSQLQLYLEKTITLSDTTNLSNGAALRCVQQYAVDFALDPKTAHPRLSLSRDLKQVRFNSNASVKTNSSTNPTRFVKHLAVLAGRSFSSGRFYFEVFVDQKTEWIVGVATESVQRKGKIAHTPDSGIWALHFQMNKFEAFSCPNVPVHQGRVERVGVFVDYDGGQVSFYDVKAATLIHSFNGCVFTEKLHPYFNPCNNEFGSNLGPVVIVPVSHK